MNILQKGEMQMKIQIEYNPYKMKTKLFVNEKDIEGDSSYSKFNDYINNEIPLQTWIEPMSDEWDGFVNELVSTDANYGLSIKFIGRQIDYDDFKRSLEVQNSKRQNPIKLEFRETEIKYEDDKMWGKVREVAEKVKTDRFKKLVDERKGENLKAAYEKFPDDYKKAEENEFNILFVGLYSSGKSTILNALIRHDILPTAQKTCTDRICKIKHNEKLKKNQIRLVYQNNKYNFDNDEECLKKFKEISEKNGDGNIEIQVNLSHLYPKGFENKFKIVLIDTPGVDSGKSSMENNGTNVHKDITLELLKKNNKSMVVFCAEAARYEADSISKFMDDITAQSEKEKGGFKDRYVFLLHKGDNLTFDDDAKTDDEKIKIKKNAFIDYITDNGKRKFVPRIFYISAAVQYWISNVIYNKKNVDSGNNTEMRALEDSYDRFNKIIAKYKDKKYYFAKYADVPGYRKEEYENKFNAEMKKDDKTKAVEIQCGMIAFEDAIKDYIERYAFPIKIQSMLETYEYILDDVSKFIRADTKTLENLKKEMEKNQGIQGKIKKNQEEIERKKGKLEGIKNRITTQQNRLKSIKSHNSDIDKLMTDFEYEIETNDDIIYIRKTDKIDTSNKPREEVEKEIERLSDGIVDVFNKALEKSKIEIGKIIKQEDKKVNEILQCLTNIVNDIEEKDLLKIGEYNFKNGITWKTNFEKIHRDDFADAVKEKIIDAHMETRIAPNSLKKKWENSWFIPRLISKFMQDSTYEQFVGGSYSLDGMRTKIVDCREEICKAFKQMGESYSSLISVTKKEVEKLIEKLVSEIEIFQEEVKAKNAEIQNFDGDITKLNEKKRKYDEECIWLNSIKELIEGEKL